MSDPNRAPAAVFLSYAREDSDAARRIADALRAFGIEVWFDQSELRGGDAWDAKIKKQIRECILFVPIVSQHTQERGEGYFRREWKLAVERTHDMAAGVPFLLPIVIDDTAESEALVPDELMRVQWTRLSRGVPSPQFVEQVKRLIDNPRKSVASGQARREPAAAVQEKAGRRGPTVGWIAVAVVAIVAMGIFGRSRPSVEPKTAAATIPPSAAEKPASPAAPAPATDKSIAVLPFTNMSDDKESGFFTDGMHEDILTNLALIRELRVVSRTSVMQYRNTTKSIGQVAKELGVAYILEGSVRRAGNKVRVTGQLIHAATDEHVWAKAYDRDLTDIFAIQAELSQQIAGALKAALSPEEKVQLNRRPTENTMAYDFFLQARDISNRLDNSTVNRRQREMLLEKAVELDPNFAQAWGDLADTCAFAAFVFDAGMEKNLIKAKDAIDRAVQLAPDDPDVIRSLGTYYYYSKRDYVRATEQYEKLVRLQPNNPTTFNSLGLIQRRQGNWAQAVVNQRRATELDPANVRYLRNLLATEVAGNHFEQIATLQRRIATLLPGEIAEAYYLAGVSFYARGSTREADDYFASLSPAEANSPAGLYYRRDWAFIRGDYAEAIRLDRLQPYYDSTVYTREEQALFGAEAFFAIGDHAGVVARLGDAPATWRKRLETEPNNARNWIVLGLAEALLGNKAEAIRCVEHGKALNPESRDAVDGTAYATVASSAYDWVGDKEKALAEYARLLRRPNGMNPHFLAHSVSTLHGDPRFEALVKDPANNAPQF